ncbi:transporter associated domain-containing protein, partial [Streptomyces sp. NPDC048279]|uniref:transporter associated domain-containing protein n=1 Tax=Streptomyces sp. NPDC048279 TaxID=3154714 RepID=UPI00344857FF
PPDGPDETLAALVAAELGRIPETGDGVEVAGWRLDVVDASGRRAARVLLHAPHADAQNQSQEGHR